MLLFINILFFRFMIYFVSLGLFNSFLSLWFRLLFLYFLPFLDNRTGIRSTLGYWIRFRYIFFLYMFPFVCIWIFLIYYIMFGLCNSIFLHTSTLFNWLFIFFDDRFICSFRGFSLRSFTLFCPSRWNLCFLYFLCIPILWNCFRQILTRISFFSLLSFWQSNILSRLIYIRIEGFSVGISIQSICARFDCTMVIWLKSNCLSWS